MAHPRRIEKIQALLREMAADILGRKFSFPEGTLVTVTRVEVSDDLYYATVFVSVLGADSPAGEEQEKAVLDRLSRSRGLVQGELNRRLRMRPVPRITFAIDQEEKRRERIEKLLSDDTGEH